MSCLACNFPVCENCVEHAAKCSECERRDHEAADRFAMDHGEMHNDNPGLEVIDLLDEPESPESPFWSSPDDVLALYDAGVFS